MNKTFFAVALIGFSPTTGAAYASSLQCLPRIYGNTYLFSSKELEGVQSLIWQGQTKRQLWNLLGAVLKGKLHVFESTNWPHKHKSIRYLYYFSLILLLKVT